ncbi:iron-hydroxamate ABC transporter substrate-binding protein [Fictibacillus sp. KU28468]|uniref:iron-hydroxamate ABC transporter substrate-binding protein n=1 Tax=Fictibacillus sp. KU28468 TaxID=2991053 RepID=UPI00223E6748|nr:iron-hydroxamate ABC transporter substrate-binding protein [Fictibacillus sp. KU28468]UZJ78656.1 iron-hydroxamate ABC transporter substrate-binding protein [Fictibacillus sp. KU28468]
MNKRTKKLLVSFMTMLLAIALAACGNKSEEAASSGENDSKKETRIYKGEKGDVEVPAEPKRVAMMAATYAGNLLELGITPIAVNEYPKQNKFYGNKLDKAEVVTADSYEKLLELNPDLIITYSDDKNIKKYKEIAPTVTMTYDKYDYLEQHVEIGKMVGKEKEAKAWVEEWKKKAADAREKVKSAIGEDKTFMVMEAYGKDMYVYGKNWGRGTEVIYQALQLKAPAKLEKDVFGPGWKAISTEVIPTYAGDYIFVGTGTGNPDNSFMKSNVWKELPAVKNGHAIKFDSESFYFNDPISLEKELDFIVNELTKKK